VDIDLSNIDKIFEEKGQGGHMLEMEFFACNGGTCQLHQQTNRKAYRKMEVPAQDYRGEGEQVSHSFWPSIQHRSLVAFLARFERITALSSICMGATRCPAEF
jgi:hypothetical protein